MKTNRLLLALIGALLVAGCSTTQSRANRNREFSTWPAAVQTTVLAGHIDMGFTREQVQVALGDPDYRYQRTSADGTTEVWSYRDHGPRFSFGVGLGMGSWHGNTATSTGIGIGTTTGGRYEDEKVRVLFDRTGRVERVEEVMRR